MGVVPSAPGDFLTTVTDTEARIADPMTFLVTPVATQSHCRRISENRSRFK